MPPLTARVHDGRLTLDAPTDLPEGAEVEVVPLDGWDALDDVDRARLHEALARSAQEARDGKIFSLDDLRSRLRANRR